MAQINNQTIYGNVQQADTINNYGIPLEQLIELAKKLGVVESERDAWMQKYRDLENQLVNRSDDTAKQAKAFLDKGDLTQAEKLFKQALDHELANLKQATLQAAQNAFSLAQIKDLQYETAAAIGYYRQGVQLDPDNANGWNQLGILLYRTGELNAAIAAHQTVLKLGKAHQDQQGIAVAYGNLGVVYYTRGEWDKAIEMYNKALAISKALGRKEGMAGYYGNLGLVYYAHDELDKAVEMYNKALAIDEPMDNKQGMARDYGNLGLVYQTRDELDKSFEMHNKALSLNQALGKK